MGITAIRGFNDILPGESGLIRHIEDEAFRVFSTYGFSEVRLPIVEKTQLFSRSIGETTDIVEKEMYTFPDRHGESLTLRPEGTASVVRAYIEHKLYTNPVTKLFYSGPMFRYERPQKGRYSQFYQIGAEVLGDESPGADAETIEMLMNLFARLGVKGAHLQINSLGCGQCRPHYKQKLRAFLSGMDEKLCGNCRKRIDENPLRALDCKNPLCVSATDDAPPIAGALCNVCKGHFEKVRGSLDGLGIDAAVNHRMVRGLDYYTKTAFEISAGVGLG
ncbi:MAG: histidine--tRNA ligase, partial [Deltaproteobacteria bacterium]|nr:histidine--tRNA ligase [Deltaproteobacteria bacterium]